MSRVASSLKLEFKKRLLTIGNFKQRIKRRANEKLTIKRLIDFTFWAIIRQADRVDAKSCQP